MGALAYIKNYIRFVEFTSNPKNIHSEVPVKITKNGKNDWR